MSNYESEMFCYVQLAVIAHRKQQQNGCVKFLLLAGVSACKGAYYDVADHCCQLVLSLNPQHLLAQYGSFSEALQSDSFQPFIKQLERYCNLEKAEFLLQRTEPENLLPSERELGDLPGASMELLDEIK